MSARVVAKGKRIAQAEGQKFRALSLLVFSTAVSVVAIGLLRNPGMGDESDWLVFGVAAAVAGVLSVRSGKTTALSLDLPILLAAGLVLGPALGGAIAMISYVDPREWRGEISVYRALCNRGQTALSVIAGSAVFIALGGELGVWPRSAFAGLLALGADMAVNYGLVALMTSLRVGTPFTTSLLQLQVGPGRLFAVMYLAYGLMSVLLAEVTNAMGMKGFAAFLIPLALAKGVFEQSRQVIQLRRDHEQKDEALRAATKVLVDERRDERSVLAGELHDEVLPPLFKVHLMGQILKQDLVSGQLLALDDDLPELLVATEMAQTAVRDVVRGLRTAKVGPGGLVGSIEQVAQRLESAGSPRFALNLDHVSGSEPAELLCYQLAREAMSNAAKHSEASEIRVDLRQTRDGIELVVADDGKGFDVTAVDSSHHFGLSLIGERARALNGSVTVSSGCGLGTTVRALVPSLNASLADTRRSPGLGPGQSSR